jgi:hypothetical protein
VGEPVTCKPVVAPPHYQLLYLNAISKVEALERRMFGPNSFFLNNGVHPIRDLFEPEPDLSDEEENVV